MDDFISCILISQSNIILIPHISELFAHILVELHINYGTVSLYLPHESRNQLPRFWAYSMTFLHSDLDDYWSHLGSHSLPFSNLDVILVFLPPQE